MKTLLIPIMLAPALALAQGQSSSSPPSSAAPSTTAANPAATCAACHGAHGEGNARAGGPRLAGQPEAYLERQLESIASGARKSPTMEPIVRPLSPDQRKSLAQMYSQMQAPAKAARASANTAGRNLADVGDNGRRIQACRNCHGPEGVGEPPTNPYLAGIDEKYLARTLGDWKSGDRNDDPSGQMQGIAKRMAPQDIEAVARYYASLAPPKAGELIAKGPAQAPQPSASPGTTTPTQGVGIEQGSPTSGGSQGAGGSDTGSHSGGRGTNPPSR